MLSYENMQPVLNSQSFKKPVISWTLYVSFTFCIIYVLAAAGYRIFGTDNLGMQRWGNFTRF